MREPAKNPCGSCPYRRDVPSGVWDSSEYAKLVAYDADTPHQPTGVFLCHQQNGAVCSGWAGCHDMDGSLALRLAVAMGLMTAKVAQAVVDYVSPVRLFRSGAEAAAHGMAEVDEPGEKATRTISKLVRKQSPARHTAGA